MRYEYDPPKPSFLKMLFFPKKGDLLCFDGRKWSVTRRYGWTWPVDDPGSTESEKHAG